MKKTLAVVAILAMAVPAMAVTWNFDDWSTQGWTLAGSAGAAVAGNPVEHNYDNVPDPSNNSGALFLPDGNFGYIYVDSTNSFKFTAEVAAGAADINLLKSAGMGYRFTYDADTMNPNSLVGGPDGLQAVNAWFEGKSSGGSKIGFKDAYSGNGSGGGDWLDSYGLGDGIWDVITVKMTIDYNYTYPGEIWIGAEAVDFIYDGGEPAIKAYGPAAWNNALGDYEPINMIRLGGAYSWSQCYADNVTFIPEPATLCLLLLGLPMLRRRR